MEALYFVALVSFILGSMGYVTVRFLLFPIFRYGNLKRRIAKVLVILEGQSRNHTNKTRERPENSETGRNLKKQAVLLSECYQNALPHWYKLLLYKRGEDPIEASKRILGLVNIRNKPDIAKRLETIRVLIRI